MHEQGTVLLLTDTRPDRARLEKIARRLQESGGPALLVTSLPLPDEYAGIPLGGAHALVPAAQAHGPAFRRALRAAAPPERFWLHLREDRWVADRAAGARAVLPLGPRTAPAARRLSEQYDALAFAADVDEAVLVLERSPRVPAEPPRRTVPAPARPERLPILIGRAVVSAPLVPESRRYSIARSTALRLLEQGQDAEAERVVRAALPWMRTARARADLLGDVVSWSLAHGHQPRLAVEAYGAELVVADEHLATGRFRAAAESFDEARRTAFHRALHFDHTTSPLADDPQGFTAPLRRSRLAQTLRSPRGRLRTTTSRSRHTDGRTRLLIGTWRNADYLDELRGFFGNHPGFETRFVDFAEVDALRRYAKDQVRLVEQMLAGEPSLAETAESVFRPHLDWADVVFVEWCTALAALVTQVDPRDTKVVLRLHSYEAFKEWPHLTDFSRVDDMVFVSDHLRDLAVSAIPGLTETHAPRLHVVANAMELSRFRRPKSEDARFTLAVVGASKVVKDPRWAIDVLRCLREHDDRYRLLLLRGKLQDATPGSGAYAEGLRQDLAELEPSGVVEVLSHTDDVPAALERVGVVVSSSVRESFHMGLVEGAASGAVPVVRDWPYFPGGARKLFPDDWVVDSPEDAARRILAVTSSEAKWRRTAETAAAFVLERWDWPVVRREFERLLRP
jgi:glycosyltransferase involved in cell wall biosynthesis